MANPIRVRQTAAQRIGPRYCCKEPLANFRFKIVNLTEQAVYWGRITNRTSHEFIKIVIFKFKVVVRI